MDSTMTKLDGSAKPESEVKTTRKEYSDGSYEEIRIEKVEGGYIKCVAKHWKDGEDWKWDEQKSVSIEDPTEEKSLVDKLSAIMNIK
jgi:hypothetical protein